LAIIIQELSPKSTFLVRTRLTSVKAAADHSSFKGTDMTSWSAPMSSRVGPIVLVLTGLLSAPGQAQLLLGPVWESNITLTQDDLDLIHRTVDTQIHGKLVEQPPPGAIQTLAMREPSNLCASSGKEISNVKKWRTR
jgi:hypothetical protein